MMEDSGAGDAVPDALAGRSVLVTGGAGFIGGHITRTLAGSCQLRVLDDLSTGERSNVPEGASLIIGDIREPETISSAVKGVDTVFHQAGLSDVTQSIEDPSAAHGINATGSVNLFEAARREDARVVIASSAAVYGHPTELPVTESQPKHPESPYGVSKLAADHYARLYHDHYGLPTVTLRYFNVYGPQPQREGHAPGVVAAFLRQARSGGPLTVHGDGTQTRDFVHVDDVVRANLAAADPEVSGGRAYNVGTGTAHSVNEVAETIRAAVGTEPEVVRTGAREGDIRRSRADISRAWRDLGYEPHTEFKAGIAALVDTDTRRTA